MSTEYGLHCKTHDVSEMWLGKYKEHVNNLLEFWKIYKPVFLYVYNRPDECVVSRLDVYLFLQTDDPWPFLMAHDACELEGVDEYGRTFELTSKSEEK